MRISDWSSDVCSSDLRTHGALLQHRLVILDQIQNFRFTGKEAAIYQPFIARPLLPEAEHAGAALFQPKGTIAAWLGHGRERAPCPGVPMRSEEHTSELQSLMRISYAVFCLKKKKTLTTK